MIKLLKIIILQGFWFLAVETNFNGQAYLILLALFLSLINYPIIKKQISISHYLFSLFFFTVYGITQEWLFIQIHLIEYPNSQYPWFLISLYIVFIGYYGDVFNHFRNKPWWLLSLLGGIGGVLSYYGGSKIAPLQILTPFYFVGVGLGWSLFFPLSFKVFYEGFMWNKFLDSTIFWSFDRSGFLRHQKYFAEELKLPEDKKIFITGGTSGMGKWLADLWQEQNQVFISGRRDPQSAHANGNLTQFKWDAADWNQIDKIVEKLPALDFLVLNAGGMPAEFSTNEQGIEYQFASQLFGHYYFCRALQKAGKLKKQARIVWVTSGGMYLKKLELNHLNYTEHYDKVDTYANVKKAQVSLLEFFQQQFPQQIVTAMHPGWADTPGVESAIPKFSQFMQGRLRTPAEGADTINWILLTQQQLQKAGLYFDRKLVKKNLLGLHKTDQSTLDELIKKINQLTPS